MEGLLLDQGLAPREHPSVLLLRVQGLDAQGQADFIRSVCLQCESALNDGAAVSDADTLAICRYCQSRA
jgi:hypothetical protein